MNGMWTALYDCTNARSLFKNWTRTRTGTGSYKWTRNWTPFNFSANFSTPAGTLPRVVVHTPVTEFPNPPLWIAGTVMSAEHCQRKPYLVTLSVSVKARGICLFTFSQSLELDLYGGTLIKSLTLAPFVYSIGVGTNSVRLLITYFHQVLSMIVT